jgi:hypothetical protein
MDLSEVSFSILRDTSPIFTILSTEISPTLFFISTAMKANYVINAGDMSVIRPMVYCRESLMTDFAKNNNIPMYV